MKVEDVDIRLSILEGLLYIDYFLLKAANNVKPKHEVIDPGMVPPDCMAWLNYFDSLDRRDNGETSRRTT